MTGPRTPSPADLAGMPSGELAGLLAELAAILAARLAAEPGPNGNGPRDELLTAEQAATRLGLSVKQVYRRAGHWPFTRRLSARTLRFDRKGVEAYLGRRGDP